MLVLDKKIREKIEEKKVSNERVKVIEMDELYTYTERRDNTSKLRKATNSRIRHSL